MKKSFKVLLIAFTSLLLLVFIVSISFFIYQVNAGVFSFPVKLEYKIIQEGEFAGGVLVQKLSKNAIKTGVLEIPSVVTIDEEEYSVVSIGLLQNVSSNLLIIPETIMSINIKAFLSCNIKKIVFPTGIDLIMNYYATNTEEFIFTGNTKKINLFTAPRTLKKFTMPKTVTEIDRYTFYECPLLTTLILPPKLKKIGYMGLGDALTELTFEGEIPPKFETDEKTGDAYILDKVKTVYIPLGCKEIYQEQLSVNFPNAEFIETK